MSDGMDGGPEQGQVVETQQMGETKRLVIDALKLPIPLMDDPRNKPLKDGWINGRIQDLEIPQAGDMAQTTSTTDASLSFDPNKEFVNGYFTNLGIDLNNVLTQIRERKPIPSILKNEVDNPREQGTVWVTDEYNQRKYLACKSDKIDGLQVLVDGSAVKNPTHTDRTVRPIIVISTK